MTVVQLVVDPKATDPAVELRRIADEIEAGEHGGVGCAALVIMGDEISVFPMGDDYTMPSVVCLLQSAAIRLMWPVINHGRDDE